MTKTQFFFLACIPFLFGSCNEEKNKNTEKVTQSPTKNTTEEYKPQLIQTHCLLGTLDKDTLMISYVEDAGTVSGKLKYSGQTENSKGDISGLMAGDTLKLSYNFTKDGTPSDREVWFLKKENLLKIAVGKYDETGLNYANYKNITYTGIELHPTDCKKISKDLEEK